jgi:hypothetical protein
MAGVSKMRTIQVVFDGPPAHESGRFVEVEEDGKGVNFGEWKQREDGYWVLEFDYPAPPDRDDDAMREKVKRLLIIVRAIAETDDHERLSEITVDIPSRNGYPRQWIRAAALAEVDGEKKEVEDV